MPPKTEAPCTVLACVCLHRISFSFPAAQPLWVCPGDSKFETAYEKPNVSMNNKKLNFEI